MSKQKRKTKQGFTANTGIVLVAVMALALSGLVFAFAVVTFYMNK